MKINMEIINRIIRNLKTDRKYQMIIAAAMCGVIAITIAYRTTMFVGGVIGSAFAGEKTIDTDKSLETILGKKSTHYQGCGFPELEWGMSVDEVKKALPQQVLRLEKGLSYGNCEHYLNENEFSFIFNNGKLIATQKYFPFSDDGSSLISQAVEIFGDFEDDDHFKTSLENTVSSMKLWNNVETVNYNFGDTQAAIIIVVRGSNRQRTQKSFFLSFIDTKEVQASLKEYAAHVFPQISWMADLVVGIKEDGKLNDFPLPPPQMAMKSFQYTPGMYRIGVVGEEKQEEAMDGWQFRNLKDKDKELAPITLDIDRARTNQYKNLPMGNIKGMLHPVEIDMPEIAYYLIDNIHMGRLHLRLNDIMLQTAVDKGKVTHYLQNKLAVESVDNTPVKAVPYSRIELPNGYVFELLQTNEIRFFKTPPN